MIVSDMEFKVTNGTTINLDNHVQARLDIIDYAMNKKYGFPGAADFANPNFWAFLGKDNTITYRGPKNQELLALNQLENNAAGNYALSCQNAAAVSMWGGVATFAAQAGIAGTPDSLLKSDTRSDFIPGDGGYVENTGKPAQRVFLGENIIYVGNELYWGNTGNGIDRRKLKDWVTFVFNWNGGAAVNNKRLRPTVGLSN
jgi:hypothetical protein